MDENYIEKYKKIIYQISNMENKDFVEPEQNPTLERLEELFPKISFSRGDLHNLNIYAKRKEKNDITLYQLSDTLYGNTFYQRHGHMMNEDEKKEKEEAEVSKPNIDAEYVNAFSTFFEICEKLSDSESQETDFEEVFDKMYEYNFKSVPKNPIMRNYYMKYRALRESEEERTELLQENEHLAYKASFLEDENNSLRQRNEKIQKMLSKTLEFCEQVRNSRFGKFLFRKQIKELPEPERDEK